MKQRLVVPADQEQTEHPTADRATNHGSVVTFDLDGVSMSKETAWNMVGITEADGLCTTHLLLRTARVALRLEAPGHLWTGEAGKLCLPGRTGTAGRDPGPRTQSPEPRAKSPGLRTQDPQLRDNQASHIRGQQEATLTRTTTKTTTTTTTPSASSAPRGSGVKVVVPAHSLGRWSPPLRTGLGQLRPVDWTTRQTSGRSP